MDAPAGQSTPKKRWLPRFRISLRALLFVVVCAALGGTFSSLVVRAYAEKEVRVAQAAAEELPARWAELESAVNRMDPRTEDVYEQFIQTVDQANSKEALVAVLGEPQMLGHSGLEEVGIWILENTKGNDKITIQIKYDQEILHKNFIYETGNTSLEQGNSSRYPSPANIGTNFDLFILFAAIAGMLAGGCFGLVAWGLWCLVRRRLRPVTDTSVA